MPDATDKPASLRELSDSQLFDQDAETLATPDYAREIFRRLDAVVIRLRKARGAPPTE